MTTFSSIFSDELSAYLLLKEKKMTTESYNTTVRTLKNFDECLADENMKCKKIPESIVCEWIQKLETVNSRKTVSDKVSILRCFLKYLTFMGYPVYMPDCPKVTDTYIPYIYSDHELKLIFEEADRMCIPYKSFKYPQIRFQMPVYLRILYSCGLRATEAASLRIKDIDFGNGTLFIQKAKNRKQRIVPMDQTLTDLLLQFCLASGAYGFPNDYLFPAGDSNEHLCINAARAYFRRILKKTGIYIKPEKHMRGQCIHCFRHVFAIKSFAQAESYGRSTADSVPYLSVYLGHYDMDGTEKYLKFCSEMFPEFHKTFEAYTADVFPEVDSL